MEPGFDKLCTAAKLLIPSVEWIYFNDQQMRNQKLNLINENLKGTTKL